MSAYPSQMEQSRLAPPFTLSLSKGGPTNGLEGYEFVDAAPYGLLR